MNSRRKEGVFKPRPRAQVAPGRMQNKMPGVGAVFQAILGGWRVALFGLERWKRPQTNWPPYWILIGSNPFRGEIS